jgi:hypothetical protein
MNTKRLSDTMNLWFVTAVQDADKLEVMPRTQEMCLKWDNFSDPQRRMRFIEEVRWILSFFFYHYLSQDQGELRNILFVKLFWHR